LTSAIGSVNTRSPSTTRAAVHLGVLDVQPTPAETDPRREVGGRVEAVGEDTVEVGDAHARLARVDQVDPAGLQPHQQSLQRLVVRRTDRDRRVRGVAGVLADVEAVDDVVAFVLADVVENAAEDAAVHEVAGESPRIRWQSPSSR